MPTPDRPLDVVLVWHFHQPDYRDRTTGEFRLPWTYLHAIKDYADMAWHLEHHREVRAVVNFVPVLLDQLEDYSRQFNGGALRDPLLRLLAHSESERLNDAARGAILEHCFNANRDHMIGPFAAYRRLHDLYEFASRQGTEALAYLSDQYLFDSLTWYHLAWTGETVRRESELVTRLMSAGRGFSHADRLALLALIGEIIRDIVPRFRRLAERGQIELSATPHHHPLAPLLIEFASARESTPQAALPQAPVYPGGKARVAFHVDSAIAAHERRFGARPHGMWPAEGGVSAALLRVLGERGLEWTASGERVIANSLARAGKALPASKDYLYRAWRLSSSAPGLTCFFRDDRLSDLIGFEYKNWNGRDAAAHFIGELAAIAKSAAPGTRPVVSVILDGENAWEWYPYNGYYFLEALYEGLGAHAGIRTTTYHDWLDAQRRPGAPPGGTGELAALTAGTWVHGDFSTWIGSPEKNRAWDLLAAAKQCFDLVVASGRLDETRKSAAFEQLAICEASDWFWWLGDYNPIEAVASFDRLFRENLGRLYTSLGLPVPAELSVSICRGSGHPESGGAMRRAS
ncbi:MAG: glycoside hydrolase [Betaproteobacteria bacterium]|nr:glycoside hydrolase [Betaproteobacteria bacterium]